MWQSQDEINALIDAELERDIREETSWKEDYEDEINGAATVPILWEQRFL